MDFGHLVQVEVRGDDFGAQLLGQLHQFGVHVVGILQPLDALVNLHPHVGLAADVIHDIQTPAAPVPLQNVAGIGHVLQFFQNKPRNDQGAVQKTALAEIGDPAVNNGRGVKQLRFPAAAFFAAPEPGQVSKQTDDFVPFLDGDVYSKVNQADGQENTECLAEPTENIE